MKHLILFLLVQPLWADGFKVYEPKVLRPENLEAQIMKVLPSARVATYPSRNALLIGGDTDTLEAIQKIIDQLDRPGQMVELEIGMGGMNDTFDSTTGLAISEGDQNVPSEFRRIRGRSNDRSSQTLLCMPGKPAELFIGETQFRDAGVLNPPIQVQAGRRISVENMRVLDNAAEFDIAIENTVPGSGPVVSSGTRLRTAVRISVGETAYVSTNDTDSNNDGSLFDGSSDKNGSFGRYRKNRRRGVSGGNISVTLRRIR